MFKRFKNIYLMLIIFVFCCILIFRKQYIDKIVFAEKSADAIAIRVIPNLENYSAIHWYKEQNFEGSPQSIIIDGYSGIRDGRTVYANVGNISQSNVLYTNIYLISYNQQAEKQTIDIFSQILNHWKFNTNVLTIGQCSENNDVNCILDSDCQNNEYCNSQKAKIIRDVNRMENLVELNKAIEKYKNIYNNYPKLSAGSYLPNKTISVWPSWQKVLAQDLEIKLPKDPINKLGDCGDDRFHEITCWDKDNKEFADSDLIDPDINLPENSKVYVYTTTKSGSNYNICSVMESGYIQGLENGACDSSESFIESEELINHQPVFINDSLSGIVGSEYNGHIEAIDQDGDELTWTINTDPVGQWTSWEGENPPVIKYLTINNQIMIYSEKAGLEGSYNFSITINDNKGKANSIVTKNFLITLKNSFPDINVINGYTYHASSTKPLYYIFTAEDIIDSYPLSYVLNGSLPNGFIPTFERIGSDEFYTFFINSTSAVFNPLTESPINISKNYNFNIEVTNNYNAVTTENFVITVLNNKPIINNSGNVTTIVGYPIDNIIINVTDFENNIMNLNLMNTLPNGIGLNKINDNIYQISGIPNLQVPTKLEHNNNIIAIDEYGAQSNKNFLISINNTKPVFDEISCPNSTRINNAYSCNVLATDPDGHSIVSYIFQTGTYPSGLSINNTGNITGSPTQSGDFNIIIVVTDEYGATLQTGYNLTVNTYCGDNIKQSINIEGRGGKNNNGQEDCDNTDGVASSPSDSSENKQYSCTTPPECSQTGDCIGTCEYTGGWCGDGIIQDIYGETCDKEIIDNNHKCLLLKAQGLTDLDDSELDCIDLNNNLFLESGISIQYSNLCNNCKISCIDSVDFNKIGTGCYLNTNGTVGIQDDDCQKGRYICNGDSVVCYDTFTDINYVNDYARNNGNPIFDQCCLYLAFGDPHDFSGVNIIYPGNDYSCISDNCDGYINHGNNNPNYLQGPASTLGFQDLVPWSYFYKGVNNGYQYNCDEVCKMRNNSICVGVGLTNAMNSATACVYDTCDSGPTCNSGSNLNDTTCKATFHYWSTHSCWDGAHVFPVKSTACYCF